MHAACICIWAYIGSMGWFMIGCVQDVGDAEVSYCDGVTRLSITRTNTP